MLLWSQRGFFLMNIGFSRDNNRYEGIFIHLLQLDSSKMFKLKLSAMPTLVPQLRPTIESSLRIAAHYLQLFF